MAILKAQDFELEFSYYDLNSCNEIEYSFDIKLNGNSFFNPNIKSKTNHSIKNKKFVFSDCWDAEDWLYIFFFNILTTKKGGSYETTEPPEWGFNAITWEDQREEKEKSWIGKTVKTKGEKDEIIDVSYTETMKMFVPLWGNDIKFKLDFPCEVFETQEYTTFSLTLVTTFKDLQNFLNEFGNERKLFFDFFSDRVEYLGDGKFQEKDEFCNRFSELDEDVYLLKRCAEWNNQRIVAESKMVLELLLTDIHVRSYCIVGTARYILQSSVSGELSKEIFDLVNVKLQKETSEKAKKKLEIVKTIIAIVFPYELTDDEISNALIMSKTEDIPEEIFNKNKSFYLKYLKGSR